MTTLFRPLGVLLFVVTVFFAAGCGGKSDTTVIQPGEGYQLTPDEKASQEQMDAAREAAPQ